jgi:hypothetical protein
VESVPCLDHPAPAVLGASFSVPVTSTSCPSSLSTLLLTPVSANFVPFLSWTTITLPLERSKHPRSVTPIEAFVAADCWLEGLFTQANKDPSKSSNNGRRAPARPKFISAVGTGAEQAMKGLGHFPSCSSGKPKSQKSSRSIAQIYTRVSVGRMTQTYGSVHPHARRVVVAPREALA